MRQPSWIVRWIVAVLVAVMMSACATSTSRVKPDSVDTQREEAARIHTALGQKYLEQGQYQIALDKLNTALRFDSNYADAHTVIALLYERIGKQKEAREHYLRAVKLRPNAGAENNNYAQFLCRDGDYAEARPYFDKSIADPFYKTPEVALTNSGTCALKAGNLDRAEHDLREAVRLSPNNAEALFQLSTVLYRKDDNFHARAFMQRLEAISPPRPESLLLGRNIELKLGDATSAQEYTRTLLQGFPDSEQARSLQGRNSP